MTAASYDVIISEMAHTRWGKWRTDRIYGEPDSKIVHLKWFLICSWDKNRKENSCCYVVVWLTHCGRVTQICVFTLQLCRTG